MSPATIVELLLSGDLDQHAQGIELLRSLPELQAPTRSALLGQLTGLGQLLDLAGTKKLRWRTRGQLGLRAAERAARLDANDEALLRPLLGQIAAVLRGEARQGDLHDALDALAPSAQTHHRAYAIANAAFDATRFVPASTGLAFSTFARIAAERAAQAAWRDAQTSLAGSTVPRAQQRRIAAVAQRDAHAARRLAEEDAQLTDMRQLASSLLDHHLRVEAA